MDGHCIERSRRHPYSCKIQNVGRAVMITAALVCALQPISSFVTSGGPAAFQRTASSSLTMDRPASTSTCTVSAKDNSLAPERRCARSGIQARHPFQRRSSGSTPLRSSVEDSAVSVVEAKCELLDLVSQSMDGEEERAAFLVETLEASFIPIQTVGFFNMAVQGKWHFVHTNSNMPPIGPRLTVIEQFQQIDTGEAAEGNVTNALVWRLEDEPVSGRLEVRCGYVLNSRGLMDVYLGEHLVLPDEGMPRDPTDLVRLLQRAMPYEMFDPNEHALETTFMDESMRIVRVRGPKHEGRVNIFVRDRPLLS